MFEAITSMIESASRMSQEAIRVHQEIQLAYLARHLQALWAQVHLLQAQRVKGS